MNPCIRALCPAHLSGVVLHNTLVPPYSVLLSRFAEVKGLCARLAAPTDALHTGCVVRRVPAQGCGRCVAKVDAAAGVCAGTQRVAHPV